MSKFPVILMLLFSAAAAHAYESQPDAQRIVLRRGDVLFAPVLEQNAEAVTIDHPVLGRVTLARDQISSIGSVQPHTDAAVATEPSEIAASAAVEQAASNQNHTHDDKPDADATRRWFDPWKLQLSGGFSGAWGNRESFNLFTRFRAKEQTKDDRWKIELSYFAGADKGKTTQNEFRANVQKDWLLPDIPWFWFAQGEYEHDQLESWRHRVGAYSGVGYQFNRQGLDVTLRIGGGLNNQFGGMETGFKPESLVGGGFEWQVNRNHKFAVTSNFYPSVGPVGDLRTDTSADWTMKLDPGSGLSLTVGLKNEYDSNVPAGYKSTDTKLFAGLTVDF